MGTGMKSQQFNEMFYEVFNYDETRQIIMNHKKAILEQELEDFLDNEYEDLYTIHESRSKIIETNSTEYRVYFNCDGEQDEVYEITATGDVYIPNGRLIYVTYKNQEYIRCITDNNYELRDFENEVIDIL
jgi:hypothetical protein